MVLPTNFGGMMTKTCYKCKEIKSLDQFYKKSSNKTDMLSGRCKKCDNALKTAWRKKNPKKVKAYEQGRWRTGNKRETDMARAQKHRDNLTGVYLRELMTKKSINLRPEDIPEELVELHRASLKLKRELRKLKE